MDARGPRVNRTPLEWAREYIVRGLSPIPLDYGTKAIRESGWPDWRIDLDSASQFFNGHRQNVGILNGEASGNLVDIDLDAREAIEAAKVFMPATGMVAGRRSKPISHLFYRTFQPARTRQFLDIDAKTKLLELRSTGSQTIVAPSAHPQGELIAWQRFEGPADLAAVDLERYAALAATAALIARHWPSEDAHIRHDLAKAWAGYLDKRLPVDVVARIIATAAEIAGDDEVSDRVRAAQDTHANRKSGRNVTGGPTLTQLLPETGAALLGRVGAWLPEPGPAEVGLEISNRQDAGQRRIRVLTLADARPRVTAWFIEPYLAFGEPALLVGDGGVGKSTLASLFAASGSVGRHPITGEPAEAFDTLILSTEEDPEAGSHVLRRFELMKADLSRIHYVQGEAEENDDADLKTLKLDDEGFRLLRREMERTGARLLIIDPIIEVAAAARIDAHQAHDVRRLMVPFRRLARDCGAVVLALIHVNRSAGGPASSRVQGSADWRNFTRSMLILGPHPHNRDWRVLAHDKTNLGAPLGASLACSYDEADGWQWHGEVDMTSDDLVNPPEETVTENGRERARRWLEENLTVAELRADVVNRASAAGIGQRTLLRAYKDLGGEPQRSTIEGRGCVGPWIWPALPPVSRGETASSSQIPSGPDALECGRFRVGEPNGTTFHEDGVESGENGPSKRETPYSTPTESAGPIGCVGTGGMYDAGRAREVAPGSSG